MEKNENTTTKNGTISAIDQNTKHNATSDGVRKDRPQKQTANDRPQNKNLKPFNPNCNNALSTEEAQRRGRLGGIKSGEVRRARKTLKETILTMMTQELDPRKLEEMGIDIATLNGDYTMQNAVISAMFREALNGSEKAAQLLRDTIDEAPASRQEIRQEVITQDDLKTIDNLKQYLTG